MKNLINGLTNLINTDKIIINNTYKKYKNFNSNNKMKRLIYNNNIQKQLIKFKNKRIIHQKKKQD